MLQTAAFSSARIDRRQLFLTVAGGVFGSLLFQSRAVAPPTRWFSSLVWAVFENQGYDRIRSDSRMRAHRVLEREGALLTHYYAVAHPSGPNYRTMVSGKMGGLAETVRGTLPKAQVPTVGDVLRDVVPVHIYHLAGRIAARHNPLIDLDTKASVGNADAFHSALSANRLPSPCLVYVGWDDGNDMHWGGADALQRGDDNLSALIASLGGASWFRTPDENGNYPALFVTYDEDDHTGRHTETLPPDNHVWACWWGVGVHRGAQIDTVYNHYSFCRTVTDNWSAPSLGDATESRGVHAMSEVFVASKLRGEIGRKVRVNSEFSLSSQLR